MITSTWRIETKCYNEMCGLEESIFRILSVWLRIKEKTMFPTLFCSFFWNDPKSRFYCKWTELFWFPFCCFAAERLAVTPLIYFFLSLQFSILLFFLAVAEFVIGGLAYSNSNTVKATAICPKPNHPDSNCVFGFSSPRLDWD